MEVWYGLLILNVLLSSVYNTKKPHRAWLHEGAEETHHCGRVLAATKEDLPLVTVAVVVAVVLQEMEE